MWMSFKRFASITGLRYSFRHVHQRLKSLIRGLVRICKLREWKFFTHRLTWWNNWMTSISFVSWWRKKSWQCQSLTSLSLMRMFTSWMRCFSRRLSNRRRVNAISMISFWRTLSMTQYIDLIASDFQPINKICLSILKRYRPMAMLLRRIIHGQFSDLSTVSCGPASMFR